MAKSWWNNIHWVHVFTYIVVFLIVTQALLILLTSFTKVITVKSKESYGRRGYQQLITDTNDHVYAVENAPVVMHFTSAEVFGKLQEGASYTVKGYGVRIPILGWFPNITSATRQ